MWILVSIEPSEVPMHENDRSARPAYNPLLIHAWRELWVILAAFAVCCIWSVTCSYLMGYKLPAEEPLAKVMGMPAWVFWGILVPWAVCDVFTLWFCFFFMVDDPLGEVDPDVEEHPDMFRGEETANG